VQGSEFDNQNNDPTGAASNAEPARPTLAGSKVIQPLTLTKADVAALSTAAKHPAADPSAPKNIPDPLNYQTQPSTSAPDSAATQLPPAAPTQPLGYSNSPQPQPVASYQPANVPGSPAQPAAKPLPLPAVQPPFAKTPPAQTTTADGRHPAGRIVAIVFGIITAIYFGIVAIGDIINLVKTFIALAQGASSGNDATSIIVSIIETVIVAVLFYESIGLARLVGRRRSGWIIASIVFVIFLLAAVVLTVILAWIGLSRANTIISASGSAGLAKTASAYYWKIIGQTILTEVVALILPLIISASGWIILTRKSVKAWFSREFL
jgi:hypothetical protein